MIDAEPESLYQTTQARATTFTLFYFGIIL